MKEVFPYYTSENNHANVYKRITHLNNIVQENKLPCPMSISFLFYGFSKDVK